MISAIPILKRQSMRIDIFCTVVDNYGDIGVTWRLARQLAQEHGQSPRLWVDDLESFRHIRPEVDARREIQTLAGVEIRHWTPESTRVNPGQVVIEALACNLPDSFIESMAQSNSPPVWMNLEYLSAESWVSGVHGLPSPHPRLPLVKYFFLPGYSDNTGGLTRETDLLTRRDAFQANREWQRRFLEQLGIPGVSTNQLKISLFSYESEKLADWFDSLANGQEDLLLIVPMGKAVPGIAAWAGIPRLAPGDAIRRGRLGIHVLPMLNQDDYDLLLWACDLNCVRGEDSFVRAQWAGRPLVWQAYRQDEEAHLAKLDAFLDLYCAAMPAPLAQTTRNFWQAWNRLEAVDKCWPDYLQQLAELQKHTNNWATQKARESDQASNLMKFINKLLESSAF